MAVNRIQTDHIVNESTLDEIQPSARTQLNTLYSQINQRFLVPGRITVTGSSTVITVENTVVANNPNGKKQSLPQINGIDVGDLTATFNMTAGTGTGDAASFTNPSLASNEYVRVGIEVRSDKKIYLVFGTPNANASLAGAPSFSELALGEVLLRNNGTAGVGNYLNPAISAVTQFGAGSGTGGSGGGTFKNYLERWFSGETTISGVSVGGVSDTGNRTATDDVWSTTATGISVATSTGVIVRGKSSIFVNATSPAANGSVFVESPTFALDIADRDPSALAVSLYVAFSCFTSTDDRLDVALVRYNSSGVYQEKIPLIGTYTASGATPPSQMITSTNRKFVGFSSRISVSALNSDDKYALRIRTASASTSSVYIDDLYVGPNIDVGTKQFADEVELREGMNVPLNLDFSTSMTIPANETKIVGKLDVATGTTINVSANAHLVTVGAITGSGTLSGSGTIYSI
jgi:hypothetical protein